MEHGTVAWFDTELGYGFITGENGKDVFVHHSSILMKGYKYLEAGESVNYQIAPGEKGNVAINVFRDN